MVVTILIQHEFWMILGVPLEPRLLELLQLHLDLPGWEVLLGNSSLKNPGMGWVIARIAILFAVPPIVIHSGATPNAIPENIEIPPMPWL